METTNKKNINPAVIGGIGVGAAMVGGAGTAAAQSILGESELQDATPVLADEIIETPVMAQEVTPNPTAHSTPNADDQHLDALEDELVAVEAIDENDLDTADAFDYGQVGVIVADDGGEQYYATAVAGDGEQITMIDIDGDSVFDVIEEADGDSINLHNPQYPTLMVSDAELQIQEETGEYEYMAQTELDNNSDTSLSGDHFMDDVVMV